MNRRQFLKIMLGTAPALTAGGALVSLWHADGAQRPVADPVVISIDDSGYLYDPDFEPEFISVREYYAVDDMSTAARLEFYMDQFGADYLQELLLDDDEVESVILSVDRVDELDVGLAHYLNEEIDPEVGSFREQLDNSPYWIGGWLYDNLPADAFREIGLDYVEGEFPGSSFCAIRFRGEAQQLNAALLRNGLNAVCFSSV